MTMLIEIQYKSLCTSSNARIVCAVLKFTNVREHDFIKDRYRGVGKIGNLRGWVVSHDVLYDIVALLV